MTAACAPARLPFSAAALMLDDAAEAGRIVAGLREQLRGMRKRGLVLGLSGGIDSSVCAALAVRAVGAKNCVPTSSSVVSNGSTVTTQFNCDDSAGYDGQVSSKASYDFAYALAAGLSYQVTKNLSVDLGYEYFAVPGAEYVAYDNGAFDVHKGVNFQTVKLGLRYDLW